MKKFLLVLAVAGFAVACNNDSEKKEVVDSTKNVIDSTADAAKDSINNMVDSAKQNIDSTVNAVKDSTSK